MNAIMHPFSPSEDAAPVATRPASGQLAIDVVDDDPAVLGSLRFLLETEGFAVRTFHSGPAFLKGAATRQADCLIIDYKMDGMDGLDVVTRLRERRIQTPVILITGYPDESIPGKAAAAGVFCVLKKPHIEDSLTARIHEAVGLAGPQAG